MTRTAVLFLAVLVASFCVVSPTHATPGYPKRDVQLRELPKRETQVTLPPYELIAIYKELSERIGTVSASIAAAELTDELRAPLVRDAATLTKAIKLGSEAAELAEDSSSELLTLAFVMPLAVRVGALDMRVAIGIARMNTVRLSGHRPKDPTPELVGLFERVATADARLAAFDEQLTNANTMQDLERLKAELLSVLDAFWDPLHAAYDVIINGNAIPLASATEMRSIADNALETFESLGQAADSHEKIGCDGFGVLIDTTRQTVTAGRAQAEILKTAIDANNFPTARDALGALTLSLKSAVVLLEAFLEAPCMNEPSM